MNRRTLAIASLLAVGSFGAGAQAPAEALRVRGAIERVDGDVLTIKTREGKELAVKLDDNAVVSTVLKASLEDVKANSFVGIAAAPAPDGAMRALEIHIFPESMRGAGEGFRPHDLQPQSTMTNGAVAGNVASANGPMLTITYKGGEQKIVVPPDAPIVAYASATRADVVAGVGVVVFRAERRADGSLGANRIIVGKNGVNPPM